FVCRNFHGVSLYFFDKIANRIITNAAHPGNRRYSFAILPQCDDAAVSYRPLAAPQIHSPPMSLSFSPFHGCALCAVTYLWTVPTDESITFAIFRMLHP